MQHTIQWQTPAPLWRRALEDADRKRFYQPSLLRFAADSFMEDLRGVLDVDPEKLGEMVARFETWRDPTAGWQDVSALAGAAELKFYQPAHGRFYLVAANLVCRVAGLPDRTIDTAADERVSFVLRRLELDPDAVGAVIEYGWIPGTGWTALSQPDAVVNSEERLPLFPLSYHVDDKVRTLLAGYIPVSSRETYTAGPALNPLDVGDADLSTDILRDPRFGHFNEAIIDGLTRLQSAIDQSLDPTDPTEPIGEDQAREVYIFALLDIMLLLDQHLPEIRAAITAGTTLLPGSPELLLKEHLTGVLDESRLQSVWAERESIVSGVLDKDAILPLDAAAPQSVRNHIRSEINSLQLAPGATFETRLLAALGEYDGNFNAGGQPNTGAPPTVPKIDLNAGARYQVRCVFERPRCKFEGAVVSPPSASFQLAPFFDSDAPVRPVRIQMPIDTSIEGLRKFPKGVTFLLSDELRKQIERVQGVTLEMLDDGDIGAEPNLDIGMICSMSIPIITICALILLMILVQLLNIIFWWLPFLKICFPLNLKAGGSA